MFLHTVLQRPFGQEGIVVVVGFAIVYILRWIYTLLTDPLRDIPGPPTARYTRLWLARQYATGHYEKTNIALHDKYGPIVRIAPDQYSINEPGAIKQIYGHASLFFKSSWYVPWGHPDFANLFNITDSKGHAAMRRSLSHPYAMSSLVSYEPYVDKCSGLLKQYLNKFADSGESVDIGRWLQYYAFDVIGLLTFSHRFGFLDNGEDVQGIIAQLDELNSYTSVVGVFPSIHKYIVRLMDYFKVEGATQIINNFVKSQIANHDISIDGQGPIDFITKLREAQKADNTAITDVDIRVAASANVLAGSDTTSISMSSVLYNLCKHPHVMDKLRFELDEGARAGTVSDPITFSEAQRLSYLQAVIKEAIRIHPATGFTMPRVVPKGGKTVSGRYFPEKTVIGVNSWVVHYNCDVYGPDAREFRPERWLEDKETISRYEASFLTFGQGARTCIGKNISLLEMSKAIPQIIRTFDLELVRPDKEWNVSNSWFVKPEDFHCRIIRRNAPI